MDKTTRVLTSIGALFIVLAAAAFLGVRAHADSKTMNVHDAGVVTGALIGLDADHGTITIRPESSESSEGDLTLQLDRSTNVLDCGDEGGLKCGDQVIVSFFEINGRNVAHSIAPSDVGMTAEC